jgi:hypothetical protein
MTAADELELTKASRKAWGALETVHVLAHFAEPVTQAYVDLGLRPRLSYFAARSAPFGAVGPAVPAATFFVFAPWLFDKTLPSSWETASPEKVLEAQRRSLGEVLVEVTADLPEAELAELLGLLHTVCEGLSAPGRPLFAAYAGLPWPDDQRVALWHAATLVREHRGDGHLALLVREGLDPVEAVVLNGLFAGSMEFMRATRGWTDEEYAAGARRLADRGWVTDAPLAEAALTEEGTAFRRGLERETDRLALEGWRHLGLDGTRRVLELATPLRDATLASGFLPGWLTGR